MNSCAVMDMGLVRNVLTSVDCNTRGFAKLGYDALAAAGSPFQTGLTLFLTLYIAVLGYRLLFARGGARLSDGPGIALKIGAILALVTSWNLFQTLVFDIAARAPVEIARSISAPLRLQDSLAANPVDGLQSAYDQLSAAAAALAKPAKLAADGGQPANAAAAEALVLAANVLFAASVGLIAVLTVAIGVLTATGPLFVALFLFVETRGFFIGWVRALMTAAFGLLSAWTLTVLMLHALEPWLSVLPDGGSQAGSTTATIVFIFAASQAGLLFAGIIIARGFHLGTARSGAAPVQAPESANRPVPAELVSRPARLAQRLQRHDASSPWIDRAGATAAAAGSSRRQNAAGTQATGTRRWSDPYRRPAVTKSDTAR